MEYYHPSNIELDEKREELASNYINKIGNELGVWGNTNLEIFTFEKALESFNFEEEEEPFMRELLLEFCVSERLTPEAMQDMEHRHGIQAMWVMKHILQCNPELTIEYKNELLVAALLHDYNAGLHADQTSAHPQKDNVKQILAKLNLPEGFNVDRVLEFISYTDYPNNGERGLHNKKGQVYPFFFTESYNQYIIAMQTADILGQMGNGNYPELCKKKYNGKFPKAFQELYSDNEIKTSPETDLHVKRAHDILMGNTLGMS